jgi:hypothetical protein
MKYIPGTTEFPVFIKEIYMLPQRESQFHWYVMEEHCNNREIYVSGEGFNLGARATIESLFLMLFPSNKLQDPVIGFQIDWSELGLVTPPDDVPVFVFDASGKYGYLSANGVSVTIKVENEGVSIDVIDASTKHGEIIRTATATWGELAFAAEEVSIIDDLQSLYRSIREH